MIAERDGLTGLGGLGVIGVCVVSWPLWPLAGPSEDQTGWSIKKFVRTARRYRIIEIRVGAPHQQCRQPYPTISAKLDRIHRYPGAH